MLWSSVRAPGRSALTGIIRSMRPGGVASNVYLASIFAVCFK